MHHPYARNPTKWVEILVTGGLALTGVVGLVGGARILQRVGRGRRPGGIAAELSPETATFGGEPPVLEAELAGGTSSGLPSFLNPCGDSRLMPNGELRYTTLIPQTAEEVARGGLHPDFPDTRDICMGAPCSYIPTGDPAYWSNEPGVSSRPYTYFDEQLFREHLARGMGGSEAVRKSMRSAYCLVGKWRPMISSGGDTGHHWCQTVLEGTEITHRGQTMECRQGKWKRPGEA